MEALIAGLAAPITALFQYNRGNFMYDRGQELTKRFQSYTFKVNQFGLYREDVRDLVALTLDKTSNYQIVVALELGFIIALIGGARLLPGTPPWITWLTFTSLCESVLYLTLGLMFASHASISAASYGARLLTQFVRLPVPSEEQLTTALTRANDFEGAKWRKMLRMPFLKIAYKKLLSKDREEYAEETKDMLTPEEREQLLVPLLLHVRLLRKLQQYWLNFDAYSRIALALGTYCMLKALCFYSLAYYVHEMKNFYAGVVGVIIFTILAVLLMSLDMHLSGKELTLAFVLFSIPSLFATIAIGLQYGIDTISTDTGSTVGWWRVTGVNILVPIIHASAAAFMCWFLKKARPEQCDDGSYLPRNFRLVHFLDMFKNFQLTSDEHSSSAIDAWSVAGRDLDPILAKRQAEEALLGAVDEWKGKKNRFCVMRLLVLSLELADAAELPAEHNLVMRAKLHLDELKIMDAMEKEKRILQLLQSPSLLKLLPKTTQNDIELVYETVSKVAGIATEVQFDFSTEEAWFRVEDVSDAYYLSLSEPHRRKPNPPPGAVIVSLRMIRDDVSVLQRKWIEIEKLLRSIHGSPLRNQASRHKPNRWYREVRRTQVDKDAAQTEPDQYSIGRILAELGSAFAPSSPDQDIDKQMISASLFPWRLFRIATISSVVIWTVMGFIRCLAIDANLRNMLLFVDSRHNTEGGSRRLAGIEILPRINHTLFDPSTLACANERAVVGNFYMAYDAMDESNVCSIEHKDLAYVGNRLMALSVDGTQLLPCDEESGYSVDIAVRRFDASMDFAVGIRKTGNDVLLFERHDSGFRAIAALWNEPVIDVSIAKSHVYALIQSAVLTWRLADSSLQPTVFPLDSHKEYVGFCVIEKQEQHGMFLLERHYEDNIIIRTQIQRLRM